MNLVPTWSIAIGTLVIGLVGGGIATHFWHADTIADLEVEIAQLKSKQAQEVAKQYKQSLDDLTAATKTIKDAAAAGQTNVAVLSTKLDAIDRKFKNAKPPAPLPFDCKPGTERVRRLAEGAAAVDEAIARPVSR